MMSTPKSTARLKVCRLKVLRLKSLSTARFKDLNTEVPMAARVQRGTTPAFCVSSTV